MLYQFYRKNYKSIREEMTFNMQATAIMEHRDKIIQTKDGENFLLVSVIYEPNGGGKSNVLETLHTLDAKVLRPLCATCDKSESDYKVRKIPVEPFVFQKKQKRGQRN